MTNNTEITKQNTDLVKPSGPKFGTKKGIALNRHTAEQELKKVNPLECQNRLGLVIDDSGSMGQSGMEDVHKGVRGFTSSCNMLDTSIAVYPLNSEAKSLVVDYDLINLYVDTIWATGGTPLFTTLKKLIETEEITRAVVFSDGSSTDRDLETEVLYLYKEKAEVPIDTIYIGYKDSEAHKTMIRIAEKTGGTCLVFSDTQSLGTSLKYLAPRYRALLANADLKAKIEKGEQI